jgi:RNA polymerase sigma factor (sigma-70 family)
MTQGNDGDEWSTLVAGLRAGDPQAARTFWQQYGAMLHEVADRRLAPMLRRRVAAEDVVQSVCRTFFRRVQGGELVLEDAERLWHLLCAIAIAKTREQARYHGRQKRNVHAQVGLEPAEAGDLVDATPSPESALVATEIEGAIDGLDEDERQVVLLKIADLTNEEIAERLGCSERTVRRLISKVREQLADLLAPA